MTPGEAGAFLDRVYAAPDWPATCRLAASDGIPVLEAAVTLLDRWLADPGLAERQRHFEHHHVLGRVLAVSAGEAARETEAFNPVGHFAIADLTRRLEEAASAGDRVVYASDLGGWLVQRFDALGDGADLDRARRVLTAVRDAAPAAPHAAGDLLRALARTEIRLFRSRRDHDALDRAIGTLTDALAIAPEGEDRAVTLLARGNALGDRYPWRGDPGDLRAAAEDYEAAWLAAAGDPDLRHRVLGNHLVLLHDLYRFTGDETTRARAEDLRARTEAEPADGTAESTGSPGGAEDAGRPEDAAVEAVQAAMTEEDCTRAVTVLRTELDRLPRHCPRRASHSHDLSVLLMRQWGQQQDPELIHEAVAAAGEAVRAGAGTSDEWAFRYQYAESLRERSYLTGALEDLREGRRVLFTASETLPESSPERASLLGAVSGSHLTEYQRGGDRAELRAAETAARTQLGLLPERHAERALAMASLANLLRARHRATDDPADLEAALSLNTGALDFPNTDEDERERMLSDRADILLSLHHLGDTGNGRTGGTSGEGGAGHLSRVEEITRALAESSPREKIRRSARITLVEALGSRVGDGDEAAARELIGHGRELLRSGLGVMCLPSLMAHMAAAWLTVSDGAGTRRARVRARRRGHAYYRDAIRLGHSVTPSTAFRAALDLAVRSAERGSWEATAASARQAVESAGRLLAEQRTDADLESRLRQVTAAYGLAGYALTRLDRPAEAAAVLERGRALRLRSALLTHESVDRRARAAGAAGAADELREVRARLAGLAEAGDDPFAGLRGAEEHRRDRARLAGLLREVGTAAGMPPPDPGAGGTAPPPPLPEGSALVHVQTTGFGTALIALRAGRYTARILPELRSAELLAALEPYVAAYRDRRDEPAEESHRRWRRQLNALCGWAGKALVGPLAELVGDAAEVIVVPGGLWSLVPLHAAVVPAPSGGRTPAARRLLLRYVPTAATLFRPLDDGTERDGAGVVFVDDPSAGTPDALRAGESERAAVLGAFPRCRTLAGAEARHAAVRSALRTARVAHVSSHGYVNMFEPRESALVLADEDLTVGELLDEPGAARGELAVLSACETALPGTGLPDECTGFPAAFLQLGWRGVISTLWSVDEEWTGRLMGHFYAALTGGLSPAAALRAAQEALMTREDGTARAPYYWAGFIYSGQ
ncbi:CHAT domain-containing protein [Streptomyces sp. MNU89]|uniref:CHAT domain-containing protein n=1 Tax=Streptomyces sp. MNU89 TaxID=2560025 RepID=UPI001E4988C1|nr:CHAT domain-containing protein [Streptomyces sp. MNU89]MCC9741735.1 CHAT domain-containing protein [Streptomyces sp. MNU89]